MRWKRTRNTSSGSLRSTASPQGIPLTGEMSEGQRGGCPARKAFSIPTRNINLPLTREVAKPQVLTEGEKNNTIVCCLSLSPRSCSDSSLVRGSRETCLQKIREDTRFVHLLYFYPYAHSPYGCLIFTTDHFNDSPFLSIRTEKTFYYTSGRRQCQREKEQQKADDNRTDDAGGGKANRQ